MIRIHEHHGYRVRATLAWDAQDDVALRDMHDTRNYFAGYCLDAIETMPAGSMQRIDPKDGEPFAASTHGYRW
ncbi:hypothetical protein [Burkholderia cenocepacia]|uniref:hypothetical protein n=1 Tax=Burkholderia cenocepacia TaxID=95486 RepID=UPI001BA99718|nr:hypothetical protein [Burkholderia cenocepacia]QUN53153.1 hypothetical protein KEH58_09955 [Burkholderia cenocepacia]